MKRILSLIMAISIAIGVFAVFSVAADLTASCSDYKVSFAVSGAIVKSGSATPSGNGGTLDIVVTDVNGKITIKPTFSNSTVQIVGTSPSSVTLDASSGSASTSFLVMAIMGGGQPRPGGTWNINVTVDSSEDINKPKLKIITDLSEDKVEYTLGDTLEPLEVMVEHSFGDEVLYSWYSNDKKSTEGGTLIEGEFSESYTPSSEQTGTTYYYVIAKSGELSVTSKIAAIVIKEPVLRITEDLSEEEFICVQGKKAPELKVIAEYTGVTEEEISYQWYKNTTKSEDGGEAIEKATEPYYTPNTDELGTMYYYVVVSCEGKTAISKIAAFTIEVDRSPESGIYLGITKSNGSLDEVTFEDADGKGIVGLSASFQNVEKIINVILPHSYNVNGKVKAVFTLTQENELPFITTKTGVSGTASGKAVNNKFTEKTVTLSKGSSLLTFYLYDSVPTNRVNNYETYTLSFKVENELPAMIGENGVLEHQIRAGEEYNIDLSDIFCDPDGDIVTYTVKVNGEIETLENENYSFTPLLGGSYELEFFASDFMGTSLNSYKVILNVENSDTTYDMTVMLPEDISPSFYITEGYDESGIDILGEALIFTKGETTDGATGYIVSVPENISEISLRDISYGGMAIPSASGKTIKLKKVNTEILDAFGREISGTVKVLYNSQGITGVNGNFLLVPDREYSFEASPENSSLYNKTTEKILLADELEKVSLNVTHKNPKTIVTTKGASVKLYKFESNYYVHKVYEPLYSLDNNDGTTTHYFSADGNLSYRVSMDGKITKAGYLLSTNSATVLYSDTDSLASDRVDYALAGTDAAGVADDSLLLNINQDNHLYLEKGDTKTLKAYRAWEIINSFHNHIVMPDFNFNIISGEDVVTIAPYENQPTTNSSGNWRKLEAIGTGTAIIEVTYDAMLISGGEYSGFYGATDPYRTGLFVVTVGEDVPEVDFGIICKTGEGSRVYNENNAKPWDSEFDTLYFIGERGEIKLSPSLTNGNITEVSVSSDKGESFLPLNIENGVYTSPLKAGNNIIRVSTDRGTAYKVIRADEVNLVIKNKSRPGKAIDKGDEITIKLMGLHTPIPKISGSFNPGYNSSISGDGRIRLYYSFGEETIFNEGTQYNFSLSGNTINFTVPEDEEKTEYALTDGYIGLGVIGVKGFSDDGDSHRNIPDSGGNTRASETTFTTRSLLPDIVVRVGMLPSGNMAPFIRESAPQKATLNLGGTYALSMSKVFSDPDKDKLYYTAKNGDVETEIEDGYYKFTPKNVGSYEISFVAYDGEIESEKHSLVLTVKDREEDSEPSLKFDILESEIAGYVKVSFEDKGKRVKDEDNVKYPKALGTIISSKKVPFKKGDTVADVTLRLLDALDFTYEHGGNTKNDFYLASIGSFTLKGIEYDSFGEFDAGTGSGWMITLNKEFIEYGASEYRVKNGDVIRWQYTCQLGEDIGDPFYTGKTFTEPEENKEEEKTEEKAAEEDNKVKFQENTFSDVKKDDWHYEAVKYVYENNLMRGTGNGFEPDGKMSRAMLVTVLYRLAQPEFKGNAHMFSDVPGETWYSEAVSWAYSNGIINGISNTEFAPDSNVSREQMALIIYRFAKMNGFITEEKEENLSFSDINEVSDFALSAIIWANNTSIIAGTDERTLSPKASATRAQVAEILMRFLEIYKNK